jgi:hypothetical protein
MKLLKINKNESIDYPYSIKKLKEDYPNTSFPEKITDSLLEEFNVYSVNIVTVGDDYTKNYTEGIPVLVNNQYYQNWIISDATEEEINQRINNKWSEIRNVRNQYLIESDWTQLLDSPLSGTTKLEWSIYRQELRDVTLQQDPFNIVWPIKPE